MSRSDSWQFRRPAGRRSRLPRVSDTRALSEDDVEEIDALPVMAAAPLPAPAPEPPRGMVVRPVGQVVAQAAAVAVTSFAAGALATAVVRKAMKPARRPVRRDETLQVVATRTFLVDVHMLGARE